MNGGKARTHMNNWVIRMQVDSHDACRKKTDCFIIDLRQNMELLSTEGVRYTGGGEKITHKVHF